MPSLATNIALNIRASDLQYVEDMLAAIPNGAKNAIRSAINDTLKSERAQMVRTLKDEINLPSREIRSRIQITDRPHSYSLRGTLSVDYQGVPLEDFKPKSRKSGLTVTMLKDEGPLTFKHAFKASMPSGHRGVFSRRKMTVFTAQTTQGDLERKGFGPGEAFQIMQLKRKFIGRGIRKMKRLAHGGNFPRVTPKGIAWRLPIDTYRGVPVVAVFEHKPELIDQVSADTMEKFHDRLMSKIDWMLTKAKPFKD